MANNLIQIKRTAVSGRAANTTTLPNPGELALNMTDGILYSGNGSVVFEIGANTTNSRVSGNLTVKSIVANNSVGTAGQVLSSNGTAAYWSTSVGYAGSKGDIGFVGSIGFTGSLGNTGYTGSKGDLGYVGSQGANSLYTVSNTAPLSATAGDRWFNSDLGIEVVYTYDGDSYQWVEIAASGFVGYQGSIGPTGYTGSQGPSTMPMNFQTSSYVASANDNGGIISITTGGVTINSGVFSNGQNITIFNNSGSSQTITANGVTMYLAGSATTGNRTLAQRGICSVFCMDSSSNTFVIAGTGLS